MGRKSNQLILAIDFGGSMTKAIGGSSFTERFALAMEPDVIELPRELLIDSPELNTAHPENSAWIGIEGKSYAVGYYARCRSIANPMLAQPKINSAAAKTLAAVWVMKEKLALPSQIRLDLCCVLPSGEYEDRNQLEKQLRANLNAFETPTGKLIVRLETFNCKPEGAGIFLYHGAKKREQNLPQDDLAVVMLGYRNLSLMVFERGNRSLSQTSELGSARLVKNVIAQTSGQNLERLAPAVAQYLEDNSDAPLHSVLRSNQPQVELAQIKQAIALARQQYEIEVGNWLLEVIPRPISEIVLCGGTADTFRQYLLEMLEGKKVYLHAQVELPKDVKALGLGNRFGDVWVMWDYFIGTK